MNMFKLEKTIDGRKYSASIQIGTGQSDSCYKACSADIKRQHAAYVKGNDNFRSTSFDNCSTSLGNTL